MTQGEAEINDIAGMCQIMEGPDNRRKRVLYVENDPDLFETVAQMLELIGYEAFISMRSKEALRLMESQPEKYDLVITDLNMPEMDGLELTARILEIRPDIPVVLCTGLDIMKVEREAKKAGVRVILPKPFFLRELKLVISNTLGTS